MREAMVEQAARCVGGKAKLAAALGVTPPMVTKMIASGLVPARHCKRIEVLTGGEVTAEMLRPDIFN